MDNLKIEAAVGGGMSYRNVSSVPLYVVIETGPKTQEAWVAGQLRTTKFLLNPKESKTLEHANAESRVSASTDTSPAYGKVTLIGGSP